MSEEACHHCAPHLKKQEPVTGSYLLWNFLGSLACSIPVMWISMKDHRGNGGIQWALTSLGLFVFGWPIWKKAWASIRRRTPNMFTLIGVGLLSAYGLSVWLFFEQGSEQTMGFYFEGAASLLSMVLLGQVLEGKAHQNTRKALDHLMRLVPATAKKVMESNRDLEVPVSVVRVGDRLRVLPGAHIPLDGKIVEGSSAVDESSMTGESQPIEKTVGDFVMAGTLNGLGSFVFLVEKTSNDTVLSQMIDSVLEAQSQKVPIQKLADRISAIFTPWVFFLAGITGLVWWIFGAGENKETTAVIQAISVLMVACPCALGLATPISILIGTTRSARLGILFQKPEAIQSFEKVDTLVFDKTGTLTEGAPHVVNSTIFLFQEKAPELWRWIASLEKASEHPLAQAVLKEAERQGVIDFLPAENFQSTPGKGIEGRIAGKRLMIGNQTYLEERAISIGRAEAEAKVLQEEGKTVLWVAVEGQLAALLGVRDPIRPNASQALADLRATGMEIYLASGDNPLTTKKIATELGISNFNGGLLPQQKAEKVRGLQAQGKKVCFLGDGINDAPALTQADLGIAMGTGTDIARQSAGITLLKGDLSSLIQAYRLSHLMMRNIRQNLFWAFSYNLVGIPLAAGLFFPWLGWKLSPMFSSFAMTASSLLVVGNALRLSFLNIATQNKKLV